MNPGLIAGFGATGEATEALTVGFDCGNTGDAKYFGPVIVEAFGAGVYGE